MAMLKEGDFDERVFLNGQSELESYVQQDSADKERLERERDRDIFVC